MGKSPFVSVRKLTISNHGHFSLAVKLLVIAIHYLHDHLQPIPSGNQTWLAGKWIEIIDP